MNVDVMSIRGEKAKPITRKRKKEGEIKACHYRKYNDMVSTFSPNFFFFPTVIPPGNYKRIFKQVFPAHYSTSSSGYYVFKYSCSPITG